MDSKKSFSDQFIEHNWKILQNRYVFFARLIVISLFLIGFMIGASPAVIQGTDFKCFWDGLFDTTRLANQFLQDQEMVRNFCLILSSLIIDILLVNFNVYWLLTGKTWRPVIFIFLFYLSRKILQDNFILRFPDGLVWNYPGFPSLSVSYQRTSDFYFSGHVGLAFFCAIENHSRKSYKLMILALVGTFFEFFVLLFTRTHYSIDLFAGLMFAHYYWILSGYLASKIDPYLKPVSEDY